jgi:aspartate kinase
MRIVVVKFGGNTINDAGKLSTACSTVSSFVEGGSKVVVVVSAIRGVTDALKDTLGEISGENFHEYLLQCEERLRMLHEHSKPPSRETWDLERQLLYYISSGKKPWVEDSILVKGEELFSRDFAHKLSDKGIRTELLGFKDPIFPTVVYGYFGNARCDLSKTKTMCEKIKSHLKEYDCVCIPGYGGVDRDNGRVKTLRRGGSDAVATALNYGFSADGLWILTDVSGIKRAHTSKVTKAPIIPLMCVEELRDAGLYGAKVPNEVAIRPLMLHCPQETFIAKYDQLNGKKSRIVDGREVDVGRPIELAAQRAIIIYEFNGADLHAVVPHLESELHRRLIDFISLGGGEYTRKIIIPSDQEAYVDDAVVDYKKKMDIDKWRSSLVGIVGKGMEKTPGIIGRMGSALARKGINIYYQFDVSPISCGVIVDRPNAESAVELLYDEFGLSSYE